MPSPWIWDEATHRYRNAETGRFIGYKTMVGLRDRFVDAQKKRAGALADQLASGAIDVYDWQRAMEDEIKTTYIDQYILGHGGRNTMTPSDWGRLGAETRKQYGYLGRFTQQVLAGELTDEEGNLKPDALRARAELYIEGSTGAYERGRALGMGLPELPAYPGDGSTDCLVACRCSWRIEEVHDDDGHLIGWDCYWQAEGDAGTCATCGERARTWNPLRIMRPGF